MVSIARQDLLAFLRARKTRLRRSRDSRKIRSSLDILVLIGRGPIGSGMEETYQITSALKHISWGRDVAVVTDARFSGVSTGACIGHVGPEALAGGPIGKVRDGDTIQIEVNRNDLSASVNLVGDSGGALDADQA